MNTEEEKGSRGRRQSPNIALGQGLHSSQTVLRLRYQQCEHTLRHRQPTIHRGHYGSGDHVNGWHE